MPLFDFLCPECGKQFERIVRCGTVACVCDCGGLAEKDGDIPGKTLIKFKEPGGVYNPGFAERKYS